VDTQVNTSVIGAEVLPVDAAVRAVLRGPSFPGTIGITATPGEPIFLPPLSQPGTHFLEDIRLDVDENLSLMASPPDVTINVLDELLVSEVTSRPLSLDEIRDLGIQFDEESFKAFKFTIALTTESKVVEIDLPVLVPVGEGDEEGKPSGLPSGLSASLEGLQIPNIAIEPFMLEVIKEEPGVETPRIPGIIVIPGNVAFLNQFFSVLLAVSNEAPDGTPLVVRDLQAEIFLPPGPDSVVGDILRDPPFVPGEPEFDNPLRIAKTAAGRENIKPVLDPGPDGQPGTADDADRLRPQGSGNTEFLVEGVREGGHIVDIEIRGVLEGLPGGPVEVAGRARGAVVVRDPDFSLTFIHPNTVRAGEAYELLVHLQNTSQVDANLVTLSLDPRNLSGARFIDPEDASQLIETIPPGESADVTFRLEALRTGQVTASTLELDDEVGAVSGRRLSLRAGVSEQGVPLSPDTLILPQAVSKLRERAGNDDLTFRAIALLGQAHSIATAPRGSLPLGVRPISSETVIQRARELSEAAVRLELSLREGADGKAEPLPEGLLLTLQDLYFDFLGAGFPDRGWDALYRDSRQARLFGAALAEVVGREAEALGFGDLLEFQRSWADTESYRDNHITVMTQAAGAEIPAVLELTDNNGRRLGGSLDPQGGEHDVPGADVLVVEENGTAVGQFAVVTQADSAPYVATLKAQQAGTFDLGIVAPASDGVLRHIIFRALSVSPGDQLVVTMQPELDSPAQLNRNGAAISPTLEELIPDGPPQVLAVVQEADPEVDVFGRVVALLFDEDIEERSANNPASYSIDEAIIPMIPPPELVDRNEVRNWVVQFGNRIVFLGLRDPVGPFVPRTLDISGVRDLKGQTMVPVTDHPIVPDPDIGPGGQLTGRVLRADGSAVANPEITYFQFVYYELLGCQERIVSVKTGDEEGRYGLDFVSSQESAYCSGRPFRIRARDLDTEEEGSLTTRVRADGERLTLDIVLLGRGSVEGTVRNSAGATVANAAVHIESEVDGSERSARTDQNGFYRIDGVSVGPFGIKVTSPEGNTLASGSIVTNGAVSTVNVTVFAVAEGVVEGEVRFPDGTIAPDVKVFMATEAGEFLDGTTTDAAGTFRFEEIPPGSYIVRASDSAASLFGDARITVTSQNGPENPVFVLVLLNGTGSVSGTVFKGAGTAAVPVPAALVAGGTQIVTTDAEGRYLIPTVPVGVRQITAADPETGATGSRSVTILTAGQKSTGIDIVVEPLGTVTGRVLDPNGQPVAGLEVRMGSFSLSGRRKRPPMGPTPSIVSLSGSIRWRLSAARRWPMGWRGFHGIS
jgi:hypothetical protein